MTNIWILVT